MTDPAPDGQADLFDRWLAHRSPPEPAAPVEPLSPAPPTPAPPAPARPVRKPEQPHLPAAVDEDLAHPTFRPRRTARLVTGLLLLASLGVTALLAWEAYGNRTDLVAGDLVPVGIAAALSLVLWAVRSSTSVARLSVDGGHLTITRNGETWRCDLAGRATPVEVVGRPGRRGWKVVFARRGHPPYVVDASMVDPVHFTRVLAHYRPDVVDRP
ncbi:hypothetical protein ENKNEFLB_00699 [Nocardioides aquaticus]|uniref:PH domain-containing protein n=1 Tax=Nocardioides aquaticus TaxID=160826 RepID=A0ABX8EGT7_9ACTN|nr:hypothetical protein [Nocardioides aquaticus]QVT78323.1 hypothetical protein ENKNEFLB_00699 [Nocardioides aquaticus]